MPTTTVPVSHPSFPIPLFTQLVRRLRCANVRYEQIAQQCRCTQRLTYHAKRRAYRAGLRIDTSKARATWPDEHSSAASIQTLPVLTAGSPAYVVTEIEAEEDCSDSTAEDECTPGLSLGLAPTRLAAPEVAVQKAPATVCLSPLGLGLSLNLNVDDADGSDLPVPGAPRWRPRPLPEEEDTSGIQATTLESVSFSSHACDSVCRGATYVSDSAPTQFEVVYAGHGLGITVPPPRLKRKRCDVGAEEDPVFSRQAKVSVPADGYFPGAWWNEAQWRQATL